MQRRREGLRGGSRVTLSLKRAQKFSVLERAAFSTALTLPFGLHAAACVHLLTRCCSECLPARLHRVGGEDKGTVNIRSLNSWPGALKARLQNRLSCHQNTTSVTLGPFHILRNEIRLWKIWRVHLSFTQVWSRMGVPRVCIRRLLYAHNTDTCDSRWGRGELGSLGHWAEGNLCEREQGKQALGPARCPPLRGLARPVCSAGRLSASKPLGSQTFSHRKQTVLF